MTSSFICGLLLATNLGQPLLLFFTSPAALSSRLAFAFLSTSLCMSKKYLCILLLRSCSVPFPSLTCLFLHLSSLSSTIKWDCLFLCLVLFPLMGTDHSGAVGSLSENISALFQGAALSSKEVSHRIPPRVPWSSWAVCTMQSKLIH